MGKVDKLIEKMRNNPLDWHIADLEKIALHFKVFVRNGKGSHATFSHANWTEILTVPAHRPIKAIYVKKFLALIDNIN